LAEQPQGSAISPEGSYTTGATSTATKLPLSLRETPQSVSVVTHQLVDDQHLSTLNEVLAFTPGISSNHRDSERYSFYSRGFEIQNYQYDGIPSQIANESQQYIGPLSDMAIYNRVEVVRGATSQINYTGPYYKAVQDPFAVVGLLANYQVDEHLSVGLNVNNLFDKKYYDGMGTFNSGSYGEPRNAMVNAKWKF